MARPTANSERVAPQAGFSYLGLLFALALLGMSLAMAGTVWSVEQRRAREQELLWTGQQYRAAIARYYRSTPLGIHQFPQQLAELLADERGPVLQRHLRRLYADPMTAALDWELIREPGGAIVGVASTSMRKPIKQARFEAADSAFEQAECYCAWRFVYQPPAVQRSLAPPEEGS